MAASDGRYTAMWWWLGLALFVDGIDGPIARKLEVKYVLPNWSGELLDNIIDYVTYVLIPAFALYQSGFMGTYLSFISGAIIVVSSAIYYADTGMKTKENFFKGFPVVWNMVVFTLFIVKPGSGSPSQRLSYRQSCRSCRSISCIQCALCACDHLI